MAEYRDLARDLIAADGVIDDTELKLLKKYLYADNKIVHAEVTFLTEVRSAVMRKHKEADFAKFHRFLLKAIQDYLLADGHKINDEDVKLVKKMAGDAHIDQSEIKKFLNKLKKDSGNDQLTKIADDFAKKEEKAK